MKATARRILGVTLLGLAAASPVTAQDWGQMATISSTMGVNAGRLCVGEGTRADIGCPTYAPSVNSGGLLTATALSATTLNGNYASFTTLSAGNVSFTGNLSIEGVTFANGGIELEGSITGDTVTATTVNGHYASFTTLTAGAFNGDGSGLTGVTAASTDRITSGTNSIYANTGMNTISFTTNGTERMAINSSGNIGIGTDTPSTTLHVFKSTNSTAFTVGGYATNKIDFSSGGTITHSYAGTSVRYALSSNGNADFTLPSGWDAGALKLQGHNLSNGAVMAGSGSSRYADGGLYYFLGGNYTTPSIAFKGTGRIGVGTETPQATLQVSGSFTVSTTGQTTTPTLYANTSGNVGIGTNAPTVNLEVSGSTGTNVELKVRGTSGLITADRQTNTGDARIQFSTGGTTNWLVGLDNNPSTAQNFFSIKQVNNGTPELVIDTSGRLGVGIVTPTAKLEVGGTISATALYVTATTGTISGTTVNGNYASFTTLTAGTFYGDGSGLTGVTAASSDRITSGTTNVVANGNSGYVSFTSAGSTTGYYSPGGIFAAVGISTSSNQASFTTVYASGNTRIGTTSINTGDGLTVNGNATVAANGADNGIFARNSNATGTGIFGLTRQNDAEGTAGLQIASFGGIGFTSGKADGDVAPNGVSSHLYIRSTGNVGIRTVTPTATLQVSGSFTVSTSAQITTPTLYANTSGQTAFGTTAPSATAHVSGTLMVAGGTGSETCSADYAGLMRRNPTTGRLQTCR